MEETRFGDRRTLIVWAILAGATFASFLLGAEHLIDNETLVAEIVIAVALVKIRLVAMHFMELSQAPLALRAAIEIYCVGVFVLLSALYLAG